MSEASAETQPRRFKVVGPYIQVRMINSAGIGPLRGPWVAVGFKQNAVLAEGQVHSDDLAHLLARGLVEELPAPASAAG